MTNVFKVITFVAKVITSDSKVLTLESFVNNMKKAAPSDRAKQLFFLK
jgi:hypothetical protein